jgi:hypothetical protein
MTAVGSPFSLETILTFETEMLAEEENFAGLAHLNRELIDKAEAVDSPQRVVLDMDSTEIPVYGEQEQSAYDRHFESTCYHPVLLFNREGERAQFRGFRFFWHGIWRLAEAKEGSRRKKCASEDQDLGVCDMLSPIQEPKWKSWFRSCKTYSSRSSGRNSGS